MKLLKHAVWLLVLGAAVSGCAKNESTSAETSAPATTASAGSGASVDSATAATIQGRVVFEGTAPAPAKISVKGNPECAVMHEGGEIVSEELIVGGGDGQGIKNAFVYIKEGLEGYTFTAPSENVVIDNRQCVYHPHVSGAQVNQPVQFLNSDPTLHNVHSYSKNQSGWNLGLPFQGMKVVKKFAQPEVMVALKCDVHPWMNGYVGVLPHPYYAVTDENGAFSLKNVPPGKYTVEVWHEKLGVRSQAIETGPQETKQLDFKLQLSA